MAATSFREVATAEVAQLRRRESESEEHDALCDIV
jgi:hypothetical protein